MAVKVISPLELRLLGHFRLTCIAEPVELCRNSQRLPVFDALRRGVSRTVPVGTLWCGTTENHARSLRTTFWKLPRCDRPLIRRHNNSLVPASTLCVDVHSFPEEARGAHALEGAGRDPRTTRAHAGPPGLAVLPGG